MNLINILIVNPPIRLSDNPRNIPHGLAILASIIKKIIKCNIKFIDWNAYRYSFEKFNSIIKESPCNIALIGGLIPTYKNLIIISEVLKSHHPCCKIIAGGSAAMSIPETLLNNSKVDIICTGEGEKTIINLIEALQNEENPDLSHIQGIAFKHKEEIKINEAEPLIHDLDIESDLPAYDLLPMEIYLSNPVVGLGRDIDFISSRGCPFQCSFCYQPWGNKNRCHSVEFLKEAILFLKKKFHIDFISFQDDLFIVDRKRLFEFCEIRNRFFPDLYWSCTGRANICDDELIKIIRNSGCTVVSYGFESASPKILKSMNKKITTDQMENVIKLNREYGFPIPVSFILGMPGENDQTCNETVEFCLKNNLTLDSLMFATPYPGTELFKYAIETGRIQKDKIHDFVMKLGDARDFVINLTDSFTDKELQEKYHEMILITRKAYKPISQNEKEKKIRSLYGKLSEKLFNLSKEDREHQSKHGAINLF